MLHTHVLSRLLRIIVKGEKERVAFAKGLQYLLKDKQPLATPTPLVSLLFAIPEI
jgi:hypothetical protein